MGPRARGECHAEWHSVSNFSCDSPLDPSLRREESSTQATIPCNAVQQTPKKANPRRVSPEPLPPAKSLNENAQEVQSKRSRHLEDEAQRTSEASARDRNSNTDIADNHVNGQRIFRVGSCKIDISEHHKPLLEREDRNSNTDIADNHVNGQRIIRVGSCKIDISEHRKPLLEREDESVKVMDSSFLSKGFLESFRRRLLESFQRPLESHRRLLESLLRLLDPFSIFFCGFWELRSFFVKRNGVREKATGIGLESLPGDLQESIFQRLPFKELTGAKTLSKSWKDRIERDVFRPSRGLVSGEGEFTALSFFTELGEWQCIGIDLLSKEWKRLPTLACLPSPDPNLFQEYSICGHGGLLCANVSKSSHKEKLVVFSILTGEKKELPPLHYSRNPVLLHICVDSVTGSYKVIAAGSASSSGEKDLSRRIEVYDSRTSEWKIVSDIRGPEFGLNEHQVGVCVNGVLYFVMFLDGDGQKGIVAFDIEKAEWLEDRTCVVPFSSFCNTLQLLESSGKLYLFSERECDGVVEHCIDVMELCRDSDGEELLQLRTVVRVSKSGGRGLLVYPEYICVPFGTGELCVFNTINRDGVVYDLDNGMQSEVLQPPPENHKGENFFCLNPVSFTLAPNFASKP